MKTKSGENYIPQARTPEEHLSNVLFQAANVKGWLSAQKTENATAKAECLLREAELLVAALRAGHNA
jgi:hypothetical protein